MFNAVRHRLDVGPGTPVSDKRTEAIAVESLVGEQDLSCANCIEEAVGAAAIMGLAFTQLQCDRISIGIDYRMDFGGQSAARAPHAWGNNEVPSGRRRCSLVFDFGGVLMNLDRRTVDRLHVPVISLRDCLEEPVPYANLPQRVNSSVTSVDRTH